jgi:hypothetical protein
LAVLTAKGGICDLSGVSDVYGAEIGAGRDSLSRKTKKPEQNPFAPAF